MTTADHPATLGVILAGGLARRMGGGDKALRDFAGEPLIARTVRRLAPQCTALIVNANGDPARLAFLDLPVVADDIPDFAGPLAGILAALDWTARHRPQIAWVVSAPTDAPFLPRDLVSALHRARESAGAGIAIARSGERNHPVAGLWPVALRGDLREALEIENLRKTGLWAARHGLATATWPAQPVDPFFNTNTPEELAEAQRISAMYPDA